MHRTADPLSLTLSALADPTRRAILARLSLGAATVNEIAAPFDISLPSISRHLKVLEGAGLIARGREAQWRPCTLETAPLKEVDGWLGTYRRFWEGSFDRMDAYLKEITGADGRAAVTAVRDDELLIERAFDAPVALVFRLWERPRPPAALVGPGGVHGGRARLGADARPAVARGDDLEAVRAVAVRRRDPRGRDRTAASSSPSGGTRTTRAATPTRMVTVTFAEKDGSTIQSFHQTPFTSVAIRDSHVDGWNSLFNKQQLYVENIAIAEAEGSAHMITLTTYKWVPDFAAPLMRAFRVRWALEEAGLPYRVRTVALGPEQRSPEHLARQPFGQAPAIEEDGLVLFESGAIALHIAEKSEALLPKDAIGRARAIGWLFSALNSVETAIQELGGIDFFHAKEAWTKERRPQVEAFVRDRLAMLQRALGATGLSRRALHGRRPDDGGRAAHPAPHRPARRLSVAEGLQASAARRARPSSAR